MTLNAKKYAIASENYGSGQKVGGVYDKMHKKLKTLKRLVILTARSKWKDRHVYLTKISTEVEKSTNYVKEQP